MSMSYTRTNNRADEDDEQEFDELPLDRSNTKQTESDTSDAHDKGLSAWRWELSMMVLSFAAFLALLIILGVENRRP